MARCGNTRRIFLLIMILVGIILSCLSITSCEFMKLPADHDDSVGDGIGLHNFEDAGTGECTPYGSSFSWDNSEVLAQKGSLAAPIMAGMAFFLFLIEISCCSISCLRTFVSIFLLVAIFCQGLSFSFFNSNQFCGARLLDEILHQKPCSPGQGSAFSISALLIFFLCNILMACTPKRASKSQKEPVKSRRSDVESTSSTDEEEPVFT